MLEYLAVFRPGKPRHHPRRRQVALLSQVDPHYAHLSGARIAGGISRGGPVIGIDEPLDFRLILAAPRRRTILDRAGLNQGGEEEEGCRPGPAGRCGAGNGACHGWRVQPGRGSCEDNTRGAHGSIVSDDFMLAREREAHGVALQGHAVHLDESRSGRGQPEAERRRRSLPVPEANPQCRAETTKLQVEEDRTHAHPFDGEPARCRCGAHVDREDAVPGRPGAAPAPGKCRVQATGPSATGPRLTDVTPRRYRSCPVQLSFASWSRISALSLREPGVASMNAQRTTPCRSMRT